MLEVHNYDPFKYAGANPSQHSWGSDSDRKALTAWADGLATWAASHGNRSIYYGEFGVTNEQTTATGKDAWLQVSRRIHAFTCIVLE